MFETLHSVDWFNLGTAVVAMASAVANVTKTDIDNKAVGFLSKVVNLLALNFKRQGP